MDIPAMPGSDLFIRKRLSGVLTVIAGCVAIFLPGAMIFGFSGIVGPYWQAQFQAQKADLGLILFYVLAGAGIHMFIIGKLQEKISQKILMIAGSVVCGGATFWVGDANDLTDVYLWAFSVGAGSTFIYLPAITVAQLWYPHRRGLVSGLVSMFFGLSGAVMAPVLSRMISVFGYRLSALSLGSAAVAIGVCAALFIRLPEKAVEKQAGQSSEPLSDTISMTLKESLKTRSFWLMWFTYAFVGGAGIAMVTMSTSYGTFIGMSQAKAVYVLMAFNLTNGVSRLISGFLSDITGRKRIMVSSFFSAGIAYLVMAQVHHLWLCGILAAIIGFAFGTLFAVSAPFVSDCFGMAHFGAIFGLTFTAYGFVAGILGPFLGGYILDVSKGNFIIVFTYLGSLMLISAFMIWKTSPRTECMR